MKIDTGWRKERRKQESVAISMDPRKFDWISKGSKSKINEKDLKFEDLIPVIKNDCPLSHLIPVRLNIRGSYSYITGPHSIIRNYSGIMSEHRTNTFIFV